MLRPALRALIQTYGHGTSAADLVAQNTALTAAYFDLAGRAPWSWRRKKATTPVLTIGSEILGSLPADFQYPLGLRLSNASAGLERLEYRMPEDIDEDLALDTGTGWPIYWSWRNGQVIVFPRPDAAYTVSLDYIRTLATTEFDDDTDVLPFPEQYHPIVADLARAILAGRQRDWAQKGDAAADAERKILPMLREDKRGTQTHVQPWGGWRLVKGSG